VIATLLCLVSKKCLVLCYSSYINRNSCCHLCSKIEVPMPTLKAIILSGLLNYPNTVYFQVCVFLLKILHQLCYQRYALKHETKNMPVFSGIYLFTIKCFCRQKYIDRVRCVQIVAYILRQLCQP
jgi:hypothetical protein